MPVLTAIDVLGVQRYIFATNRLRDIAAASCLVDWATARGGALETVAQRPREILLAGGGNAIVTFDTMEEARVFAGQYTRRLYECAPDLEVALVHHEYASGQLAQALLDTQTEMAHAKLTRSPNLPLLGISVTANCSQSGMPAVCLEDGLPVSRRIKRFNEYRDEAAGQWKSFLPDDAVAFPLELDKMGRTHGDTSFIAVVHLDGNHVGAAIQKWLQARIREKVDDKTLCERYTRMSASLEQLGKRAFRTIVQRVREAIVVDGKGRAVIHDGRSPLQIGLKKDTGGRVFLPMRPILLGGDDITFVCDARIAHDLMNAALQEFQREPVEELGQMYACAGAALVHTHAPFIRAYETAQQLCARAKGALEGREGCALDWYIGLPRPGESLDTIWRRQYTVDGLTLSCRPYRLSQDPDVDSWPWFSDTLMSDSGVGLRSRMWTESRNKVKALSTLAREGEDRIGETLKSWQVIKRELNFPKPIAERGFHGNRTPLLDAIELIDIYMSLDTTARNRKREGE